jgi:tRNA(Ile)-lysidine synthase|tara:strand:+ start:19626 stop:20909 length:1284 start_codon:yes stop_codon:yes gene_type:complete
MIDQFEKHIYNEFPFLKNSKLLVCVSGGVDSMVLSNLLLQLEYKIGIAHCNFNLRGSESDLDEEFVREYAKNKSIVFHFKSFKTKLAKHSTQMAARTLRYDWFNYLLHSKEYDYILTAHHLDDSLETFILNLSRASGIEGLLGIKPINNNLIRPLLIFSKENLISYAIETNIKWREDSSNIKDDYLRNKIRNNIIPQLKELDPNFLIQSKKSMNFLRESNEVLKRYVNEFKNEHFINIDNQIKIFKTSIIKIESENFIYELFKNYGFKSPKEILSLCKSISGKMIKSSEYTLLSDRDFLIIKLSNLVDNNKYNVGLDGIQEPIKLTVSKGVFNEDYNSNILFLDIKEIKLPLILRKYKKADFFYPNKMNGKKMISKYFKDEKMSYFDKQNQWLLCDGSEILWVVGMRFDKRKYITKNANIKIEFNEV